MEIHIPEVSETKENITFLFKHFISVMDANVQKNELFRLVKTQALVYKFFEHVGSYIYLSKGTNIPEILNKTYYDVGTLSVTARAAFETMLSFFYIAIEPKENEEFEFRINCLLYSGLLERAKAFEAFTRGSKITHEEKMKAEKIEIENLRNKIKNSKYYLALKTGEQKNIIVDGEWRMDGWKQIAVSSGIEEEHFKTTYGYLCTQAHSGGNSFIQMRTAIVEKNTSGANSITDVAMLGALSFMINFLIKISPYSKAKHETSEKAFGYVNFYLSLFGTRLRDL